MVRAEYLRFLQTLSAQGVSEGVRKIGNLVVANLDGLVPLSTYQGQRIRRFVALAQTSWAATSYEIQPISVTPEVQAAQFAQLKRITIGPFRGFARQEVFDLESRLVLIYGPNGTGKSSFCEALEYGLLGNVVEAESKRFRDQNDYFKNAYVNQFSPPNISADDGYGNEIVVTPNESAYRFCFVEKNRIDSFSRIAAQAPAKQTELISTLFGLEAFTDFVRNFTAEISDQYIDVIGKKAALLAQKRLSLSGAQQQIQGNTVTLQSIASEEQALANQYRENVSFSQMVLELNGDGEILGAIGFLEAEIQKTVPPKSNLTIAALETLGNSIVTTIQELNGRRQTLAAASQQVSFKRLYEAISQVQPSSPNICPACKTSLNQVDVNPYANAEQELQKLQQLAAIQQDAERFEQNAKQYLFHLSQIINICLKHYSISNPLKPFEVASNEQPNISWWESLLQKLPDGFTPWQHLVSQVGHLEANDKNIDQAAQQKSNQQTELNNLRDYARQVTVLQTRRQSIDDAIKAAQQLLDNFQNENAQLMADVEAEIVVISRNQAITSAYAAFVTRLNDYSNSLPAQLVADLGEIVVDLYNSFNRNDSPAELLANVKLPLAQNQRLSISFQNQPNTFFDALHVLSEGHIRCLGLAILLAKNLKENAPVLIFDDPVNAIDEDHKESIRRTLFDEQYFANKQILLTCHGEEFFKDIQNQLPAETIRESKSFSFLPRLGDQHIRVDFNCAPRNYIVAARGHIERNEVREALAKSRQALESLTKIKVWQYVTKHGDGNLSIKLRSAKAPIELRNLADQLRSKINSGSFGDSNKNVIFTPLDALLGPNGESREWRYLNKGTHDESDRAEFDRYIVEAIISNLESLDAALV
jgi:recombinational DNA repair ATPase RecF